MQQNRVVRLAVGAAVALGGVGAVVVGVGAGSASAASATGAASAAAVHPDYWCSNGGVSGICTDVLWEDELDNANDEFIADLPAGSEVNIECWYYDTTPGSDGYYDHVAWSSYIGNTSGHLDDRAVDFNNETPPEVGLPECAS